MKPESKKKRIPIKQEDDDISFNLSSLKEVVEDCTEKKKTSSSNTKISWIYRHCPRLCPW
ncbi:hypothetical protein Bca52824_061661 [Brassica carinata]|uniref:Uncharacterized protein n=1 Tax=Brassica carinata TaxID=52824 RepID=A0A8X7UIR7_BRACI|nr:hypothetical protein Bca52824_061661 [Brassica carinata]